MRLRSRITTEGLDRTPHRAFMRAMGLDDAAIAKPMIGVVSQVTPFAVETEYPTEIAGTPMRNYIDWMRSSYYVTLTGHPAISVPCGFTDQGLPVGLQIVGRHRDEWGVLQLAHAFEQATQFWKQAPKL